MNDKSKFIVLSARLVCLDDLRSFDDWPKMMAAVRDDFVSAFKALKGEWSPTEFAIYDVTESMCCSCLVLFTLTVKKAMDSDSPVRLRSGLRLESDKMASLAYARLLPDFVKSLEKTLREE